MSQRLDAGLLRLVDQLLLVSFRGQALDPVLTERLEGGLAGVILFADNIGSPGELRGLVEQLRDAGGQRLLVAVDEEGGEVTRMEASTGSTYPTAWALGAVDDVALTREVARAIAGDLAAAGINFDLAPVADVNTDPDNPVIGLRSFGSDPRLVARHVAAFVDGLQGSGVAACAKHFPGHGATRLDSHLDLPVLEVTLDRLRAVDLVPFSAAVEAGARAVMTAHVVFTALDRDPATISAAVLRLLRDELMFDGVLVTDALTMAAIRKRWGVAEGAVRSLIAGADLLCVDADPQGQEAVRRAVLTALSQGRLAVGRLEEAAGRVAALAQWARPTGSSVEAGRAELGLGAARRAVRVDAGDGVLPVGPEPYVVEALSAPSSRIGTSVGGFGAALAALAPGTTVTRLEPSGSELSEEVDAALAAAAGRPLVVVVRDAHRYPWQREILDRIRLARPDSIVVGTGTPHDSVLAPGCYVGTLGSAPPCLQAAAEVVCGVGA